jgi:hypothetical protein
VVPFFHCIKLEKKIAFLINFQKRRRYYYLILSPRLIRPSWKFNSSDLILYRTIRDKAKPNFNFVRKEYYLYR